LPILKYTKYFCNFQILLRENIFYSKLRSTSKREIFLQDKRKSHGKADACHGFLTQYCGKRSVLKRINPYVSPPFRAVFLLHKFQFVELLPKM